MATDTAAEVLPPTAELKLPPAAAGVEDALPTLEAPGHPRRRIMQEVQASPGVSITDLAALTGLGHTTVCHHLAVLQRRGLVVRERWGGSVRVFPTNLSPTHRTLLALARSGRTGDVLRALAGDPRATPASLARTLQLHRQAVQWHLARLEKAGMIRVDREHRPYRLALTVRPDAIMRLLPPSSMAEAALEAPPTLTTQSPRATPG
jgi:DNA-binding transcriptional ArsR family regulator